MIDLTYSVEADTLILGLKGRLDDKTAPEAEGKIFELLQRNELRWIVDLAEVEHISGAGLRVLLTLAKKLSARRGRLVLCSPRPEVDEVLSVAGFNRIFKISASLTSALRMGSTSSGRTHAGTGGAKLGVAAAVAGLPGTSEILPSSLLPVSKVDRIADVILRLLDKSLPDADAPPSSR